jgi:hypothetical protein
MPIVPNTKVTRYRLYIDESGDHTLQLVDNDNHRYLGLLGLWFDTDEPYKIFAQALNELKRDIFAHHPDDPPICLHRKDLIDRKGVFRPLHNQDRNERFERGLIKVVQEANFCMTCVVIDKASHRDKTYRELVHPYHYCLTALLERYTGWLFRKGETGDVMAESRGGREDRDLRTAFETIVQNGTQYHSAQQIQTVLTSKEMKLKKKEHAIPGLELADLLVYPFKREMIYERRAEVPPKDFSAALLDAVRPKMNCHLYSGRVAGYGKAWLE